MSNSRHLSKKFIEKYTDGAEGYIQRDTEGVSKFIAQVYNWMFLGLLTTGITSMVAVKSQAFMELILTNQMFMFALIIAEFGMVMGLAGAINKMTARTASILFMVYSVLNGLTFSTLFFVYTTNSIASTFFITAATFGALSFYGYTTKKDLTSVGNIAFMGLIGIIIASVVNIFMMSPGIMWVVTYVGVLVFVALTAYDTQKLKHMYASGALAGGSESEAKGAILGALTLYLDFINLFILMLQIFGNRRD